MSWYASRLERDLARWQSAGWVSDTGAASIRADLASRKSSFGAAGILATLSAVLFGFAIMSFVAANWEDMSKLARLLLLLVLLWACYGAAIWLTKRQLGVFVHAAVLAGIAVYGASIMLISQMYHMEGNAPDAVLLWALGALVAAVLVPSPAALGATFVLVVTWSLWERSLSEGPHWGFLIVWGLAAGAAAWLRWRPGLHLAAIAFIGWLVPIGFLIGDRHEHWLVAAIGLGLAAAGSAGANEIDKRLPISSSLFTYGVAIAFCGLFILQFIDGKFLFGGTRAITTERLTLLGIVSIALLLGAIFWAVATENRPALWLSYVAFAFEVMTLYSVTIGTLLGTSLFFLVAAIIVSALAWFAYRLHQRKATAAGGAA